MFSGKVLRSRQRQRAGVVGLRTLIGWSARDPIGASRLRQVHEVVLQLRGRTGDRQVPGEPRVGDTQFYGAPGIAGVSIL